MMESQAGLTIPMFPLGAVLLPHQPMPLRVFEPRYRALVEDCLATVDDGSAPAFGIVLIERGSEVGGGDTRFELGTLAHITDIRRSDDGRYGLLLRGAGRFRIAEWLPEEPYPRARVAMLEDVPPDDPDRVIELVRAAGLVLREVSDLRHRVFGSRPIAVPEFENLDERRADIASYLLAVIARLGPLDAQTLLGCDGVAERLEYLTRLLTEERSVLAAQSES